MRVLSAKISDLGAAFAAPPIAAKTVRLALQVRRGPRDGYAASMVFAEAVLSEHPLGTSRLSGSPDISLGWIEGRTQPRLVNPLYNPRRASVLLGVGARFRYGRPDDWYHALFLGFQPALHIGRTPALSTPYQFITSLGWQGRRISIQLRHISNGSLHRPNHRETMALINVGHELQGIAAVPTSADVSER